MSNPLIIIAILVWFWWILVIGNAIDIHKIEVNAKGINVIPVILGSPAFYPYCDIAHIKISKEKVRNIRGPINNGYIKTDFILRSGKKLNISEIAYDNHSAIMTYIKLRWQESKLQNNPSEML